MFLEKRRKNQEEIFKVPKGYFEDFDNQLKMIIHPEEVDESANSKLAILKPWIGLAAAFLLIAMVFNLVTKNTIDKTETYSINYNDIENWTEEWYGTYEMIDILSEQTTDIDELEIYPDSLFLKGITYDDIVFLSLSEY